ncbi:protein ECERIFERUM 1-like [Dorcoceras hygrometricum]|uniref:Protein ECERIFERUM 1-like n=1 Tax=Dorcoceras hygrometricum TaxID=472368 RepID=A0A2Z7DGD0_9LAMI|nr:protein ECERIFERUM 1-like [Dorcoceras hygrometricum]
MGGDGGDEGRRGREKILAEELLSITQHFGTLLDAVTATRARDPLKLPLGPITRGRIKKFKEALHGLVLGTEEPFTCMVSRLDGIREAGMSAHGSVFGGLRDYTINIIQVQD